MNAPTNTTESQSKIATLFGGVDFSITHEDGSAETIRIRQLRLGEYEAGYRLREDEFSITAFCCSQSAAPEKPLTKEWVMTLEPRSYETLQAKCREVNQEGFFVWSVRKADEEAEMNRKWIKGAADLPPAVLAAVIEQGKSILRTQSPRPR